ncbi:MAG: hypothetical protein K8U03_24250 [Planctomycetia bacterium]|nr:hypothetical protein [Planctomycetia bacterium]
MMSQSGSRVVSVAIVAAAIMAPAGGGSAQAQVYVGGPGLSVGVVSPYGYGFGSPWAGSYGSAYYGGSYYGGPIVGYAPGGYGFGYTPYGYFGGPNLRGFALPPLVIPAETIYGPGAVQRFFGLDQSLAAPVGYNAPAVNAPPPPGEGGFGVLAPGAQVPKAHVAPSNLAARERAKKQLAIGDDWFRKQQLGSAATAYREAIRAAPDVADPYFHQAAIAVAQQRFEAAVEGIKSGLRISTTYLDGDFKYSALYGDNKLARTAHLEALAQTATVEPSADLYFLMGVMLFFDEQPRRAGPFFTKARESAGGETWHIDVFREILKRMDIAAAEQAMRRGGVAAVDPAAGKQPAPENRQPEKKQPVRVDADGREI